MPSADAGDALQDICVADLKSPIVVNGYPCKPLSKVTSQDFFYDGLIKQGSTNNPFGSNATIANVQVFPGLNTLGVSMNRVDFAPGGINPPHIHPRASEITVLIKGTLLVGFVRTDTYEYYSKIIRAGEVFVIPQGLVHFQKNVGKGHAYFFAAFNSQLPGVGFLPQTLFASKPAIPTDVLTKAFQASDDVINSIRANLTFQFAG